MGPREVEALPVLEFLALVRGIEVRHEDRKQVMEKGGFSLGF